MYTLYFVATKLMSNLYLIDPVFIIILSLSLEKERKWTERGLVDLLRLRNFVFFRLREVSTNH